MTEQSLESISLNGAKQWLLIRGNRASGRVLLFLHGGPGSPVFPLAHQIRAVTALESQFLVVYWEQRGTGKSYDPNMHFNINDLVQDTLGLSALLVQRFAVPKIYLMAHSFGTVLGAMAVSRRPELYRGYFAIAQIGDVTRVQQDSYDFAITQAQQHNDHDTLAILKTLQPMTTKAEEVMLLRNAVKKYHGSRLDKQFTYWDWIWELTFTKQYDWRDRFRILRDPTFSLRRLAPEISSIALCHQAPRLVVPVFFITGRCDFVVSAASSLDYFQKLEAPLGKHWFWCEKSAHYAFLEEPQRFDAIVAGVLSAEA